MDFLCKWLLRHTDVEVTLYGARDDNDKYICVKMWHQNGCDIYNQIREENISYLRVIFDEMYAKLIVKGGTV